MKIIAVDDNQHALKFIESCLKDIKDIELDTFNEPVQALLYLLKTPVDLVLLDIDMPSISGVYLAEQLIQVYPNIHISFITAYNEYAIEAFELNAIDYILKPYSKERLLETIQRVRSSTPIQADWKEMSNKLTTKLDMICVMDDENIIILNYDTIYYLEVLDRKVHVHATSGTYAATKPLSFYEDKLHDHSFFRTHKSYIVNLNKVARILPRINYTYDLYFHGIEDCIPVSRMKIKTLKELLEL